MIEDDFVQNKILKSGFETNAYIIASSQTTIWSGDRPVYRLTLKFKTINSQEVKACLMKELSFDEIERFKSGGVVNIKYDPKNPQRITLYDKSIITGEL